MKLIFAGTPHFAAAALEALLAADFEVVAVLTQPDRPAGRGMQLMPSPVKQLALKHHLPVLQPKTLKDEAAQRELAGYDADVMVVAAYGLILPPAVLSLPRHGCLNIHASLLPRWRGAAPIQRAILAGDAETGITIMQMDAGLDTGDMLLKKTCPIAADDNAQTLHDKLAALGAQAIVEALRHLHTLPREPQDNAQASYAAKLDKAEARIDWQRDAEDIARAVRGYYPFPVATAVLHETPLKIWQASVCAGAGEAGTVLAVGKDGIAVACGRGALRLEVLQRPNAKAMPAAQFVQGFAVQAGDRFEHKLE
ncbi:MAG: methionyl-tRNA formyltransferase [Gallionellaceae bacterium]|jgi:methionyl-tRNA formyltransferase|nr:methionyl-tRNA formyltransferase [Gallionellaceae bacterium]